MKRGPHLAILVNRRKDSGVPMEEALLRADDAGWVMASNRRLGSALVGSEEFRGLMAAFACWSGTMVGYDEPGKKLGNFIEYMNTEMGIRYMFPVPPEHRGKSDIALVAEHPDLQLVKDGKDMVVMARFVGVVDFPSSDGWYRSEARFDLPTAEKINPASGAARYLMRERKLVSLAARGIGSFSDGEPYIKRVCLNFRSFDNLGVIVESDKAPAQRSGDIGEPVNYVMDNGTMRLRNGCSFLSAIEEQTQRFGLERRAEISPEGLETMLMRLDKLDEVASDQLDDVRLRLMGMAMVEPKEFEALRKQLENVPLTPADMETIRARLQMLK